MGPSFHQCQWISVWFSYHTVREGGGIRKALTTLKGSLPLGQCDSKTNSVVGSLFFSFWTIWIWAFGNQAWSQQIPQRWDHFSFQFNPSLFINRLLQLKLFLSALQKTRVRSLQTTVARKNSSLTGRNLEQNWAHVEGPSCWWPAGQSGRRRRKNRCCDAIKNLTAESVYEWPLQCPFRDPQQSSHPAAQEFNQWTATDF